MKRLIIFDLDGTLVNAYPAVSRSVNYTLKALGFKPQTHAEIKRSVGRGDRHLMAQFVGEQLAEEAIRLYRPHHARALAAPGGVKFLPGAAGLLKALKKDGHQLAIASNRPTKFTLSILKILDARKYFDVVLCADRAPRPKPYPDMLRAILEKLKVSGPEALYVGDMTIDVETGHSAGIRTVAVTTGSSRILELKALKPWRVIGRINQLQTIMGESNVQKVTQR
ncbi:MAG: HAD family hydrolase [Candidatus Omnitrophica bacterium]|nr:HAD family hydrolase [Candidatus Omnitrophota bacterium]